MMKYIIINILEVVYIIYMFVIFQTKYSIHHPLEYIMESKLSNFFSHPISSDIYESKICSFGKYLAKLSVIFFILRIIYYLYFDTKETWISFYIINLVLALSLIMNLNAFIYLIPIFIIEYYLLYY